MADIENVIKGIRKCLSHKPCYENGCPYNDECAVDHLNDPLLRDALELLKEQQKTISKLTPHVLTIDEAAGQDEVWTEIKLKDLNRVSLMVTSLYITDDAKNFELELMGTNKRAFMLFSEYGKTWRCWSAKPSNEQRMTTAWKDDSKKE